MQKGNKLMNPIWSFFIAPIFTLLISVLLSSFPVSADSAEVIDTIELTVPIACTLGGVGTTSHNATMSPGTYSAASGNEYEAGIGKTTLTSFCNDANGFSIYAIGFTNNLYEGEPHTKLVGKNTNQTISTKVYASGDATSNWSMKLTKVDNPLSGDLVTYNPTNMTVVNSFNDWHVVPDTYTKVAEYRSSTTDPSTTDTILGAKLETTYAAYIASDQVADMYQGQVKYTLVHPYDRYAPEPPSFKVLYTGRALSDTPGSENPVTVRMYDLPETGKYNLMGTASGLYDKLTPDTLYGGYFKYDGDFGDFAEFLQTYQIYDGINLDFQTISAATPVLVDGSDFIPEKDAVYFVKEVPETSFLTNYCYTLFTPATGEIGPKDWWFITTVDDIYYREVGFVITDTTNGVGTPQTKIGKKARSLTITTPGGKHKITPLVANPLATSEKNRMAHWRDEQQEFHLENHIVEVYYYWVTPDQYKVTSAWKRRIEFNDLTVDGGEHEDTNISPTITNLNG